MNATEANIMGDMIKKEARAKELWNKRRDAGEPAYYPGQGTSIAPNRPTAPLRGTLRVNLPPVALYKGRLVYQDRIEPAIMAPAGSQYEAGESISLNWSAEPSWVTPKPGQPTKLKTYNPVVTNTSQTFNSNSNPTTSSQPSRGAAVTSFAPPSSRQSARTARPSTASTLATSVPPASPSAAPMYAIPVVLIDPTTVSSTNPIPLRTAPHVTAVPTRLDSPLLAPSVSSSRAPHVSVAHSDNANSITNAELYHGTPSYRESPPPGPRGIASSTPVRPHSSLGTTRTPCTVAHGPPHFATTCASKPLHGEYGTEYTSNFTNKFPRTSTATATRTSTSWMSLPSAPCGTHSLVGLLLGTQGVDQVVITGVKPDSPAARAGLLVGDRLLNVQGVAIHDLATVRAVVHNHCAQYPYTRACRPLTFNIRRGNKVMHASVIWDK